MIKLLLFLLLLLPFRAVFGQWEPQTFKQVEELTAGMRAAYRTDNYRIDFDKKVYLAAGDTAFQSESGQLLKGPGLDYAVYSGETALIQEKGLKVVFYSKNNTVYLMDPDSTMQVLDFAAMGEQFKNYDYFKKTEGETTVLKAVNKHPSESTGTEMYIRNGKLVKLRVYFPAGNYVQASMADESVEEPYMEITYSAPRQLTPQDQLLLTTEKYVYTDQGKYHLRKVSGTNYQLVDLRVPKSNTTNR